MKKLNGTLDDWTGVGAYVALTISFICFLVCFTMWLESQRWFQDEFVKQFGITIEEATK